MYENEAHWYSADEIRSKLLRIWKTMDNCIREGVQSTEKVLPGSLGLQRRAPGLYRRLTRGLYPSSHQQFPPPQEERGRERLEGGRAQQPLGIESTSPASSSPSSTDLAPSSKTTKQEGTTTIAKAATGGPPRVHGRFDHYLFPTPPRRTTFPAIDYLSVYAIAVNEVNAAGGRVVTAPTNGAAGILPSVAKYVLEFISDGDPSSSLSSLEDGAEMNERDVFTFLLTASAIGMLYKRGATISAAEGGCMAEVGVACSMAAGAFAACMGASPETILAAAEVGIEHNLGLTCDVSPLPCRPRSCCRNADEGEKLDLLCLPDTANRRSGVSSTQRPETQSSRLTAQRNLVAIGKHHASNAMPSGPSRQSSRPTWPWPVQRAPSV